MTTKEIRNTIKAMNNKEVIELNGYIIRKSGSCYGVRNNGDYMETPYTIYTTLKELINAIA